jgi:hypothetical protein
MDPDQTVRMRRLVWIHAGHKRIMLVLSWRGSILILNAGPLTNWNQKSMKKYSSRYSQDQYYNVQFQKWKLMLFYLF